MEIQVGFGKQNHTDPTFFLMIQNAWLMKGHQKKRMSKRNFSTVIKNHNNLNQSIPGMEIKL